VTKVGQRCLPCWTQDDDPEKAGCSNYVAWNPDERAYTQCREFPLKDLPRSTQIDDEGSDLDQGVCWQSDAVIPTNQVSGGFKESSLVFNKYLDRDTKTPEVGRNTASPDFIAEFVRELQSAKTQLKTKFEKIMPEAPKSESLLALPKEIHDWMWEETVAQIDPDTTKKLEMLDRLRVPDPCRVVLPKECERTVYWDSEEEEYRRCKPTLVESEYMKDIEMKLETLNN
jgi:hypothetical protein